MRKDFDIVGSFDNQRGTTINSERTVNLFEYIDPQGKRPKSLISTSGLKNTNVPFSNASRGVLASFEYKDSMYHVVAGDEGSYVYKIDGTLDNLFTNQIGFIPNKLSGYVGIDANTYQIIFVTGLAGYIYDTRREVFEQILDTGFPLNPIDVTSLDGFFVVANGGTNQFQLSSYENGTIWSGGVDYNVNAVAIGSTNLTLPGETTANFTTGTPIIVGGTPPAELTVGHIYYVIRLDDGQTTPGTIGLSTSYEGAISNAPSYITFSSTGSFTIKVDGQTQLAYITSRPGNIVACRTLHRRLFLFSTNFTEVWENQGIGYNLPFRRNNSLLMEIGTPSIGSISVGFGRMFFLSQDKDGLGSVISVEGTQPVPISNTALDYQISQYTFDPNIGVSDAKGFLIKENGLIFYRLNFTRANHTYVYNLTMSSPEAQRWHEEEVLNGDRHLVDTHVYHRGVNYGGSYYEPILYAIDDIYNDNDGEPIRRMRIGRQITPEGYNRLRIDRFHIDLLQGREAQSILDYNYLATESGDVITTESGDPIVLEQQTEVYSGQPVVYFSYSKDGGQSYGYVHQLQMGKLGQRTFRTVVRKLGTIPRGQGFTPKIEFYSEIPFIILGAAWDFEIMPE